MQIRDCPLFIGRTEIEDDLGSDSFERILDEARVRLRKERREPEPEALTPGAKTEREKWIEEINEAAEAALLDPSDPEEDCDHPMVEFAQEFGTRIDREIKENNWLEESASEEPPLNALKYGIWFASAKLAGALNYRNDEWPPRRNFCGRHTRALEKSQGLFERSKTWPRIRRG